MAGTEDPAALDDRARDDWWLDVTLSALLRAAWRAAGAVARTALEAQGYDDLPRNGAYVLGSLARGHGTAGLPGALGVTKQAFAQLADALVVRGYLERSADAADRRRVVLALTERGRAAAALALRCAEVTEAQLAAAVGGGDLATARRVLGAVTQLPADLAVG